MKIEHFVASSTAAILGVSVVANLIRGDEEYTRRAGNSGNDVFLLPDKRRIEYSLDTEDRHGPLLVLEHGLGSPLESWDWVRHHALRDFDCLRYNRAGIGLSNSKLTGNEALHRLLTQIPSTSGRRFVLVTHSFGSIMAMNLLKTYPLLRDRCDGVVFVDATDPELWEASRNDSEAAGTYRQITAQEIFSTVTGMSRWAPSKIEKDVEYRPDIQRSYVQTSGSIRTLLSAQREFFGTPGVSISEFSALGIRALVVAAADNVDQQRALAEKLACDFAVVEESSHRRILGGVDCAADLTAKIKDWVVR